MLWPVVQIKLKSKCTKLNSWPSLSTFLKESTFQYNKSMKNEKPKSTEDWVSYVRVNLKDWNKSCYWKHSWTGSTFLYNYIACQSVQYICLCSTYMQLHGCVCACDRSQSGFISCHWSSWTCQASVQTVVQSGPRPPAHGLEPGAWGIRLVAKAMRRISPFHLSYTHTHSRDTHTDARMISHRRKSVHTVYTHTHMHTLHIRDLWSSLSCFNGRMNAWEV